MSWAKFDDRYDDHPKVMAATHTSPLAAALHSQAITASSRQETDGLVDPFWLLAKAPDRRKRERALAVLTSLRLFDVLRAHETCTKTDEKGFSVCLGPFEDDRYLVHDYLDFNPSSSQRATTRAEDAARKRVGRAQESDGSPSGLRPESDGSPSGLRPESDGSPLARGSAGARPRPVPTRPDPEADPHRTSSSEEESSTEVIAVCDLLASLMLSNDPKATPVPDGALWRRAARLLLEKDGRDADEVSRVIRWCQADEFWRSNILSMPKLREKYPQLLLRMNNGRGVADHHDETTRRRLASVQRLTGGSSAS